MRITVIGFGQFRCWEQALYILELVAMHEESVIL